QFSNRGEDSADIRVDHTLTIDGHQLHRPGRQLGRPGGGDEPGDVLRHSSVNLKRRAALSQVTMRTTSSGAPAKMRSRNSRDFGHVDSACGKSLPHSMLSTPIASRSWIARSSSMNSTNMLRCQ